MPNCWPARSSLALRSLVMAATLAAPFMAAVESLYFTMMRSVSIRPGATLPLPAPARAEAEATASETAAQSFNIAG